jgi:hypothetical protein
MKQLGASDRKAFADGKTGLKRGLVIEHGVLFDNEKLRKMHPTAADGDWGGGILIGIGAKLAERRRGYDRAMAKLRAIRKRCIAEYSKLAAAAGEIRRLQLRYREIVLPLNRLFCARCSACCCRDPVGYVHSEDYIYYALLGEKLPTAVLKDGAKRCMFIEAGGCAIPTHMRPRMCITANTHCFSYGRRGVGPLGGEAYKTLGRIRGVLDDLYHILQSSVMGGAAAFRARHQCGKRLKYPKYRQYLAKVRKRGKIRGNEPKLRTAKQGARTAELRQHLKGGAEMTSWLEPFSGGRCSKHRDRLAVAALYRASW